MLRAAGLAHLLEHMTFKGTARLGSVNAKKEQALLDSLDEGARRRMCRVTVPGIPPPSPDQGCIHEGRGSLSSTSTSSVCS
jgi:predicted Zn-dependent peptidase